MNIKKGVIFALCLIGTVFMLSACKDSDVGKPIYTPQLNTENKPTEQAEETDGFDITEADSISLLFNIQGDYYNVIKLESGEHDSQINKLLSLLKPAENAETRENKVPMAHSMTIYNEDGWAYSFTFDDEYITYTGEPYSSYFSPSKSKTGIKNQELIDYIFDLGKSPELISTTKMAGEVTIVSLDGEYEADLYGTWVFREIESSGSDAQGASGMDYGPYSSCWGRGITFFNNGTGYLINAFGSNFPEIVNITWQREFVDDGMNITCRGDDFNYTFDLIKIERDMIVLNMIDADGEDEKFGDDFMRTAKIENINFFSSMESFLGEEIGDVDAIKIDYKGHTAVIDNQEEVTLAVEEIKRAYVSPTQYSYKDEENYFTFSLMNDDEEIIEFSADDTGTWIGYNDRYYEFVESNLFETQQVMPEYIDFKVGPAWENKDVKDILYEIENETPYRARVWWDYMSTIKAQVEDYDDNGEYDTYGSHVIELSEDEIEIVVNTLLNSDYEIFNGVDAFANSSVSLWLEYENSCRIAISLTDSDVYMSIHYMGEWIYDVKVLSTGLYEYIFSFAEKDTGKFSFDEIADTNEISIFYVHEDDKKEFMETRRLTEVKINDKEVIDRIVNGLSDNSFFALNGRSHHDADIIFHVGNKEYFGKIVFPTCEYDGENTIIMQGYFWYQCEELYEVLHELAEQN